jgi:hypothetical protein
VIWWQYRTSLAHATSELHQQNAALRHLETKLSAQAKEAALLRHQEERQRAALEARVRKETDALEKRRTLKLQREVRGLSETLQDQEHNYN